MTVLLDTHVLLWYVMGDSRLNDRARTIVESKTDLFLSVVSLWEIAIKVNIGKLQLNCSFDDVLVRVNYIQAEILPISITDTKMYLTLPVHATHRDPFDRMIVSQVMRRSMTLISGDTKFDLYGIQRLWD
jgi:PIN domain nuclease of toxin-antitoxin system